MNIIASPKITKFTLFSIYVLFALKCVKTRILLVKALLFKPPQITINYLCRLFRQNIRHILYEQKECAN